MRQTPLALSILLTAGAVLAQVPTSPLPLPSDLLAKLELRAGTAQELTLPQSANGPFEVLINIDGRLRTLEMAPYSVMAPDFELWASDQTGQYRLPRPEETTFRGVVRDVADSSVAGTLFRGALTATIRIDGEAWTVQPLNEVMPAIPAPMHAVYANGAVLPSLGRCGVDDSGVARHDHGNIQPSSDLRFVEIALDCDNAYFLRNGSDVAATVNAAFNLIIRTSEIYQTDVDIRFVTTRVIVRTTPRYTSGTNLGCGTPGLLQEMQSEWINNQGAVRRDIAHLFSGAGTFSGVVGCAFVGVVCSPTSGYGASRAVSSNAAQNLQLVAHEIGHNWGGTHCDASPPCNIMCASLGGCTGVGTSFGPAARAQILAHKGTRNCLDAPQAVEPNPNVYYRLSTSFRPELALDVINGGPDDNRLHMVPAGPFTGQFWRFSPIGGFPGRWRISSLFRGPNLAIDITNGGSRNNEPILANAGPFTGQFWNLRAFEGFPGFVSLYTDFRGEDLRLEGHAGATGNRPVLVPAGPFTGQMWRLTPLASVDPAATAPFGTGCAGRGGVPTIRAVGASLPWSGETFNAEVTNVPGGAIPLLLLGLRLGTPTDLAFLSSPGCLLRVDAFLNEALPISGSTGVVTLPIPSDINLVGVTVPIQGAVIDPARGPSNPLAAMSNGLDLRIGLR